MLQQLLGASHVRNPKNHYALMGAVLSRNLPKDLLFLTKLFHCISEKNLNNQENQ